MDVRRRQIDTLKVFNDNVATVTDNEEYLIRFESAGRALHLLVKLGVGFPSERPRLFVSPAVQHPWVNAATGEVELAPGILNYSPHSDLGRIVQAVIREYERIPPPLLVNAGNPLQTSPAPAIMQQQQQSLDSSGSGSGSKENSPHDNSTTSASSATTSANNSGGSMAATLQSRFGDCSLPNLSTLSLDELKQLDNDPDFFDDFIEELSVVQHLNEDLDSMINEVEIISRENESKETHLLELKRKLSDDVTALKNLGEKCELLNKKYLKKSEEYSPQHIRELLQIAASTADTDCDRHVEHFLNGKIDVQTFLNSYTCSKKLSSERKAKEERLGQQLSAFERAGI